jgi:arginine decarboxylase
VYTEKAIEMVGAAAGLPSNGHHIEAETSSKTTKKKPAKRGGSGHDSSPAEVGQDELLGQQQPGDAVTAD